MDKNDFNFKPKEPRGVKIKTRSKCVFLSLTLQTMAQSEVIVQNLTKKYGSVTAVDNISFVVEKGSFCVLLGPSGCGKTTVLKIIAGLIEPTEGTILIHGEDVREIPTYRRNISMVFQDFALFPHKTVEENVEFGLRMRGIREAERKRRVQAILEIVGISELRKRYPAQLSGGQQQRVALARSLVVEPAVLLLDEPLGSLDYRLQKQLEVEIKRLHRELNMTFIYVSHDLSQAFAMADQIILMNRGRIEQIGKPEEIYYRPRSVFVANFLGDVNLIPVQVKGLSQNRIILDTGIGDVYALQGEESPSHGEKFFLAVRAESINLDREAETCENRLEGLLLEEIFQGSQLIYTLQLKNRREVKVLKQNNAGRVPGRIGSPVSIGWRPEDSILLPAPYSQGA